MSLRDLPFELVIQTLASAASLSDLRALASTSRTIYSIFEAEKASLIYQVLANDLGPAIDDALGLAGLQLLNPLAPNYFSDDYQNSLTRYGEYLSGHGRTPSRQLSLDYVLRLVRTYRTMADLSKTYIACTSNLIEREALPLCAPPNSPSLTAAPGRSEWLRVLRAHYRLQMVLSSSLAGELEGEESPRIQDIQRIKESLFELWSPWEVQQIFCVGGFYKRFQYRLTQLPNGAMHRERLAHKIIPLLDWAEYVKEMRATDEAGWQTVLQEVSRPPQAHPSRNRNGLLWHRFLSCGCLRGV